MNSCTREQITNHLQVCDAQFIPPLSERVDIDEYAAKLHAKAVRFEAWIGVTLAGLVAVYFDLASGETFVSSVSVLPEYRGQRIGSDLVAACRDEARNRGMAAMVLDVSDGNRAAVAMYEKLGFTVHDQCSGVLRMRQTLHRENLEKARTIP